MRGGGEERKKTHPRNTLKKRTLLPAEVIKSRAEKNTAAAANASLLFKLHPKFIWIRADLYVGMLLNFNSGAAAEFFFILPFFPFQNKEELVWAVGKK